MKPIEYSKETSMKAKKTTVKLLLVGNFLSFVLALFVGTGFLIFIIMFNIILLEVDYLYDKLEGKRGKISK